LNDLIETINLNSEEKESELKKSNFLIEYIFRNLYSDINTVPSDDFTNLHLLSKLPKSFMLMSINSEILGNYEEALSKISNEIEKIKNENINFHKLRFEWQYNDYYLEKTSNALGYPIFSMALLNDGLFAVGTYDCIKFFDINQDFKENYNIGDGQIYNAKSMISIPDNKIVVGSSNNRILAFETRNNYNKIKVLESVHTKEVTCLGYIPINSTVVSGSLDGNLKILETLNWNITSTSSVGSPVRCLLYHPDKYLLLIGSDDKLIRVRDIKNNYSEMVKLSGHSNPVWSLNYIKGTIISGCTTEIKMWNADFTCFKTIIAHSGPITHLKFLPNGDLVSCSIDRTCKIWATNDNYSLLKTFEAGSPVLSMIIYPSRGIVLGCEDQQFRIWNIKV
jgi:WD40 repeat protein